MARVLKAACQSRLLTILVCIGTALLNADYDVSTELITANRFLKALVRWDAVYFIQIARNGYDLEQQYAFDPGYPLVLRFVGKVLEGALGCSRIDGIMYSGIAISNIAFILAALILYQLSLEMDFRPQTAYLTAVWFSFNPASIFLSSIYRESLFAMFSFSGMLFFVRQNHILAGVCFMFSTTIRSNGILYSGFFIWSILNSKMVSFKGLFMVLYNSMLFFMVVAPFLLFQYHGYKNFCIGDNISSPKWCDQMLPFITSHVQKHYWYFSLMLGTMDS
jgi:phosphatidylinositol glycan class V